MDKAVSKPVCVCVKRKRYVRIISNTFGQPCPPYLQHCLVVDVAANRKRGLVRFPHRVGGVPPSPNPPAGFPITAYGREVLWMRQDAAAVLISALGAEDRKKSQRRVPLSLMWSEPRVCTFKRMQNFQRIWGWGG